MIVVWGDGGHARVIRQAYGEMSLLGQAGAMWWTVTGHIQTREFDLDSLCPDVNAMNILGIGDIKVRQKLINGLGNLRWGTCIHPKSHLLSQRIGPGTFVAVGAVVGVNSTLGSHVIVNTCASVDHDCVVGDNCHIAPGARLLGGVRLGDRVFIGANAVICPGSTIGDGCKVDAGMVVNGDIIPNTRIKNNRMNQTYDGEQLESR